MKKKRLIFSLGVITLALCLTSCGKPSKKLNQAELVEEINKFYRNNQINATVKFSGSTLYIYVPLENLFVIKDKPKINTVNFNVEKVDGVYKNADFDFNYLINKLSKPEKKSQPYDLDEKASKIMQRAAYTVAYKLMNTDANISFIVEAYADINLGIILTSIRYLPDIKKFFCGVLPFEEYNKRVFQDVIESKSVIQDKSGESINYQDITLGDFLSKQIAQRIRLLFSQNYKINRPIKKEIELIIRETLNSYKFKDYLLVQIKDVAEDGVTLLSRTEIEKKIKKQ
jgi:hypothetical protein